MNSSASNLRALIKKAIEDHTITVEEYDQIIDKATEDGYFDNQEKALLKTLQEMINDKTIRFVPKK